MRKRHADVYVEGDIERESKRRRSSTWEQEKKCAVESESGRARMSPNVSGKGFEAFQRAWDDREESEEGDCEL